MIFFKLEVDVMSTQKSFEIDGDHDQILILSTVIRRKKKIDEIQSTIRNIFISITLCTCRDHFVSSVYFFEYEWL